MPEKSAHSTARSCARSAFCCAFVARGAGSAAHSKQFLRTYYTLTRPFLCRAYIALFRFSRMCHKVYTPLLHNSNRIL